MPVNWRDGAVPAACTAMLLATACSMTPARSPAQQAADETLAGSVYTALNADPLYFYRHVDVSVDAGVASLSGYVWSTEAIYRARKIAYAVPGVRQVVTSGLELERQGLNGGRTR